MKPNPVKPPIESVHDSFKLGQGYASGEKGSDANAKASSQQFGDNPLPTSGGDYQDADELQPVNDEDLEDVEGVDTIKKPTGKSKEKTKKHHH